jgi:condensin complex subunit 2
MLHNFSLFLSSYCTANINLNKLDSAFDIDPLFHKMSKTFDEGGAKGLLLANLGVGSEGCNIVFDSSCEETNVAEKVATSVVNDKDDNENDTDMDTDTDTDTDVAPPRQQEGMIDVSTLKTKLFSLLAGQSVHSLQLVPQLASLRTEHAALDAAGFIDEVQVGQASEKVPGTGARGSRRGRYAADQQQEKEADHSIHQEAMERSRASIGGRSCLTGAGSGTDGSATDGGMDHMGDDEYANDNDFGGGGDYDDGDDDDGDDGFDAFMATDENGARFSSIGFNNSFTNDGDGDGDGHPSATTVLLDAIADGNVIHGATDYQYFDAAAFASVVSAGAGAADNVWAGALHWKRGAKRRPQANANGKKTGAEVTKKSRSKKSAKQRVFVDLSAAPDNMSDILRQPPARKAKGDPLQISKTTLAKHAKADNLLPLDAGMGVEKLSSLFLRPNTILKGPSTTSSQTSASSNGGKTVGFNMAVETWDNGPDDSFGGGDDDGGDGFCFANNDDDDNANGDDFFVHQLHDVRKVDKVHVGHATVAKKVDVKRLKRDLWLELESCFAVSADKKEGDEEDSVADADADDKEVPDDPASPLPDGEQSAPHCLSFNDAVRDLEAAKSQADISLPFYFICVLHLANEKGLRLDSKGLEDFHIYKDNEAATQLF